MAHGLRVWDAAGNLIVDTSQRHGTILGVLTITGGVDGSVTDAGFAQGEPLWMCTALASYATYNPAFSFDAGLNRLSWSWGGRSGTNQKLVYGVF